MPVPDFSFTRILKVLPGNPLFSALNRSATRLCKIAVHSESGSVINVNW